jgi:hypothetical protein
MPEKKEQKPLTKEAFERLLTKAAQPVKKKKPAQATEKTSE